MLIFQSTAINTFQTRFEKVKIEDMKSIYSRDLPAQKSDGNSTSFEGFVKTFYGIFTTKLINTTIIVCLVRRFVSYFSFIK